MQITRDAAGRIAHEKLTSKLSREFRYSADGYLTEQSVTASALPLFATRYEYDRGGNLTQRSDNEYGNDFYRYDPMGRITEHLDPQKRVTRFFNDPAGDRLKTKIVERARQRIAGGDVVESEWSREGDYEGVFYLFDRAGNLTVRRDEQRDLLLIWDSNQRLVESHAKGVVTRYSYDPLGRRLQKETAGKQTRFYWDGDALLGESIREQRQPAATHPSSFQNVAELNERRSRADLPDDHASSEYLYYPESFRPFALINFDSKSRRIYHYHIDPNGCPTRITDINGKTNWAASYSAWGAIREHAVNELENPIRHQGQYADTETGLHYNRYRYDDPVLGCFVSQDPLRLLVGPNLYWYAGNRYFLADPLGLSCTFDANTNRWRNRQTGRFQAAPTDISDLVHNGRIDYNDIQAFARHHGLPNLWAPSPNFPAGGVRHQTATAAHNMSIHGHGVNPNAVANFPGSNAATGPTASIRRQPIGGGASENFRTNGTWGSFGSDPNGAHIPLDNSPF